jgi:PAS domain-containing protein
MCGDELLSRIEPARQRAKVDRACRECDGVSPEELASCLERSQDLFRFYQQPKLSPEEQASSFESLRECMGEIGLSRTDPEGSSSKYFCSGRYIDLFYQAPEPCLVTDMNGRVIEANRSGMALLSPDCEPLPDKRLSFYLGPGDGESLFEKLNLLREGVSLRGWAVALCPPGGGPISARIFARALPSSGQILWQIQICPSCQTELYEQSSLIRASNFDQRPLEGQGAMLRPGIEAEKLTLALKSAASAIIVVDTEGIVPVRQ